MHSKCIRIVPIPYEFYILKFINQVYLLHDEFKSLSRQEGKMHLVKQHLNCIRKDSIILKNIIYISLLFRVFLFKTLMGVDFKTVILSSKITVILAFLPTNFVL
jgi:hypothetical protein